MTSPSLLLASPFTNNAILQHGTAFPVWGKSLPLRDLEVEVGDVTLQGQSQDDGSFLVWCPSMPAGGPHTLKLTDKESGECVSSDGILFGEVWLASGQSNMEWTLGMLGEAGADEIATANDPWLRQFLVPKATRLGKRSECHGQWTSFLPSHAPAFSAVGYHFAKRLRAELGIPVGILNATWGGTRIEAWMSRNALAGNPTSRASLNRYESDVFNPSADRNPHRGYPADPGNDAETQGWASPRHPEDGWKEAELPAPWQAFSRNHSGVYWFRKTVGIPERWLGRVLVLSLGGADKQDITYFNGQRVGSTGEGFQEECWNAPREYIVPSEMAAPGEAVIAVRVYSFVHQGGLHGPASAMRLFPKDDPADHIPLTGTWQWKIEHDFGVTIPIQLPLGPGNPNSPHILFDNMIFPLVPTALRGVLWYQGESNAELSADYASLLQGLIQDWRGFWGQQRLDFLIVQLANFRTPMDFDAASSWARIREAQSAALRLPDTGLAVAIDIGEADDIHPKNKRDVGERLARWALSTTYRKAEIPSGPIYERMSVERDTVRLHFQHTGAGLRSSGGPLRPFQIAGPDGIFHPAHVVIEEHTLVVSHPDIHSPVAVRYAWADNPEGCNLVNSAGLPASPFRTDDWPLPVA